MAGNSKPKVSAGRKMTLVLIAVWLLLDYPWGLCAFVVLAVPRDVGGPGTTQAWGLSPLRASATLGNAGRPVQTY